MSGENVGEGAGVVDMDYDSDSSEDSCWCKERRARRRRAAAAVAALAFISVPEERQEKLLRSRADWTGHAERQVRTNDFARTYRMGRETFDSLLEILRPHLEAMCNREKA